MEINVPFDTFVKPAARIQAMLFYRSFYQEDDFYPPLKEIFHSKIFCFSIKHLILTKLEDFPVIFSNKYFHFNSINSLSKNRSIN